jgi:flagellar motor switch protein FliG
MAKLPAISREVQAEILQEFSEVALQAGAANRAGMNVTRPPLETAVGPSNATENLSRVAPSRSPIPTIQHIAEMEPRQVYNLLCREKPQTVALVLSYLTAEKAAETLMFSAAEQRDKILERLATLSPIPAGVVEKVVEILVTRKGVSQTRALNHSEGVKTAADLLSAMGKSQGKTLLGSIEERNPALGQAIRQKMFSFEDLGKLHAGILQRILREVDLRELALALKRNASDKLKSTLLGCITKRAAEAVQEEIAFMGSVRLCDIERAQLHIIEAARRLESEGVADLGEAQGRGAP